jgi:agmatine deiminase
MTEQCKRVAAEWEPHACTLVAWPNRRAVWGDLFHEAELEYLNLVRLLAEDQYVVVIVRADQRDHVLRLGLPPEVALLQHENDDGWIRDNGPIATRVGSDYQAVDYDFNAWGERYSPHSGDSAVGATISSAWGYQRVQPNLVLEGGALSWNGLGIALASEECVLASNRNVGLTRLDVELNLNSFLGLSEIVWIPFGLIEDLKNTDGHVDNVAVFVDSATVLVQSADPGNPNKERLRAVEGSVQAFNSPRFGNLSVIRCEELPYCKMPDGTQQPSPYLNFCLTEQSVILPTVGAKSDAYAKGLFAEIFSGRSVKFTPAYCLTFGGGGPHCVTMQWPERLAAHCIRES